MQEWGFGNPFDLINAMPCGTYYQCNQAHLACRKVVWNQDMNFSPETLIVPSSIVTEMAAITHFYAVTYMDSVS